MKKAPKVHPTSIANVLKKAGFSKSEWIASRQIRGWGDSTVGFSLTTDYERVEVRKLYSARVRTEHGWQRQQQWGTGHKNGAVKRVTVGYTFGHWTKREYIEQEYPKLLAKMKDALVSAGYNAVISDNSIEIVNQ